MPRALARAAVAEVLEAAEEAVARVATQLPAGFPEAIYDSVAAGLRARLRGLEGL